MGGNGDKVRTQGPGGEGDLQKALDGVGVQQGLRIPGCQAPGNFGDGEDVAQLIVDHHDADQGRVRPHGVQHRLSGEVALGVGGEICHLAAVLLGPAAGLHHGAVLHGGGDDVAAQVAVLPQGGPDGPVVALGAAGGEEERLGVAAQGTGDGPAPDGHLLFHLQAHGILGAGIGELLGQNGVHGIRHRPGHRGGGGVVQIDHGKTPFLGGCSTAHFQV